MNKRGKYTGRKTPLPMANYNSKLQRKSLKKLIRTNFNDNDYFMVLNYAKENRQSLVKAKKSFSQFIRQLRKLYTLNSREFRYIKVTRIGKRGGISHYMIFSGSVPSKIIMRMWKYSETPPTIKRLSEMKENHILKFFLTVENKNITVCERAYISSRNLLRQEN